MAEELKRANNLGAWVKALGPPIVTIALGVTSGYLGLEMRVRGMEGVSSKNAQDIERIRTLDPDGFRDPGMRSGVDRQIRASHRDTEFLEGIQFKLERAYKLETLRR